MAANSGPRVLVLYERGTSGSRAVGQARDLIQAQAGQLTVVTVMTKDTRVLLEKDDKDAVLVIRIEGPTISGMVK